MTSWPLEQFNENGFAVIENFLNSDEISELYAAGVNLCTDAPEKERKIFYASVLESKSVQHKENYFVESSNKIHYFYEAGALNASGDLLVDPSIALNKVGHALHTLHPTFKKITFDDRVKNVANKLGFRMPVVPQSMYIYKNPGIGGEVKPHQDACYLHTEPNSIIGYWIPLEDATLENGCLWFIKGSQKDGLTRRLIRNPDETSSEILIYDRPLTTYPDDQFTACSVKAGSLVLIHGLVVHKSDLNKSSKSRHAYTFHVMETENTKYSKENWLQLPENETFPNL